MIIDIHMHLGDILHIGGGAAIYQNAIMPTQFNIQKFEEDILRFNSCSLTKYFFAKYDDSYTLSVQKRIQAANLKNLGAYYSLLSQFSQRLFGDNIIKSCCMPVSPYVVFKDIYVVSHSESRLLPFTSINPNSSIDNACVEISAQLDKCFGLKLHPIIQGIPFNSARTYSILDIFAKTGKPVLFHAGASRYYLGNERNLQHCELDNPYAAEEMIRRYPSIPFIIGHSGIAEYQEWAALLKEYDNVYVDITVQPVSAIKKLISWYGEDRVLFATDWPCVNPKTTLNIICKTLTDSQLEKCLFSNASTLLNLDLIGV